MSSVPSISDFLSSFESNFEPENQGSFKADLKFKEHEEWNSMQALIVIAFIDETYGVTIDGEDIKKCQTIADLHQLLSGKMN